MVAKLCLKKFSESTVSCMTEGVFADNSIPVSVVIIKSSWFRISKSFGLGFNIFGYVFVFGLYSFVRFMSLKTRP